MKYIIDVPDKADYITAVYMDNGLPVAYKSDRLEDLKPYTEPDREAIEKEVWDFVRFMFHVMDSVDRFECFGSEGLGYANADSVVRDMTYQEAKAKYEAWRKVKDEIRVGDEVQACEHALSSVVVGIAYGSANLLYDGGALGQAPINELIKTGRHFPEVEELLKKMKGE